MLDEFLAPSVSTFLVKGNPGSGKSTLALELLRTRGKGTYVSTRVSKEKIAVQNPQVEMVVIGDGEKGLLVGGKAIDAKDYRLATASSVLSLVMGKTKDGRGGIIILDSWDSIAKEIDPLERLKVEKTLVAVAESNDLKIGFISEEPSLTTTDYIVDAVAELTSSIKNGERTRTLEIKKLRGQEIKRPVRLFTLKDGRFTICPETKVMFPGQYRPKLLNRIKSPPSRYSSGVADMDSLMGGGFSPGTSVALEYGTNVSARELLPIDIVIVANFVLNGGCSVRLPMSGMPPEALLGALRAIIPPEKVNSSVRIGYYEEFDDPCVFKLDMNSAENTFREYWRVIEEMKGESRRPCLMYVGVEKLEYVHGKESILKHVVTTASKAKRNNDFISLVVNETTATKNSVAAASDGHMLFEMHANTLTIQPLRPSSASNAVSFDYADGYPHVSFTPMV
jgi:KaiC/GvpD/RAD55 family RecA-like ATPase